MGYLFRNFTLALLIFFGAYLNSSEKNFFLKPKTFSERQYLDDRENRSIDMCWNFGVDSHLRFESFDKELYFEVSIGTLKEENGAVLDRIKDKFVLNDEGKLFFSYRLKEDGQKQVNVPSFAEEGGHPDDYSYIVSDRRVVKEGHPRRIDKMELSEIIRNSRVLFYTGAGVSIASSVPAMGELSELLGLEEGENLVNSLERVVEKPGEFAEKIRELHSIFLRNIPSQAHLALKDLSLFKNVRLTTENLDNLHEASGIFPYRVDARQLREEIDGQDLAWFDFIVCVGLSFDDRGFLGWCKKQNPNGKIIAVDINKPSYLGDEDFWLEGDLQAVIPEIKQKVLGNSL